jgi:hypothetical protein
MQLGADAWRRVAAAVGRGRSGQECRQHWVAARSDGATRPWSVEEKAELR